MTRCLLTLLALLGLVIAFCPSTPARADTPPTPAPQSTLPPIAGDWLEAVGDLGFVAPPVGSTEPRPVVVAVHGMGDRPEWECAAWRATFGPRPFIVCPRGRPWQVNFAWSTSDQVRKSIDLLLDAAEAQWGAHLDRAHRVYVGFSQGAILGARVVKSDPQHYPYVIFQEGFDDALSTGRLDAALKASGVTRILLGCSQGGCAGRRVPIRVALERAAVEARVNDAGPRGHTLDDVVVRSVKRDLPWLLGGDNVWSGVVADVSSGT